MTTVLRCHAALRAGHQPLGPGFYSDLSQRGYWDVESLGERRGKFRPSFLAAKILFPPAGTQEMSKGASRE